MAREHKFIPGHEIKSMAELALHLERSGWTYFNHKPLHPGWLFGMQFGTLWNAVRQGRLRVAEPNPEYKTKEVF